MSSSKSVTLRWEGRALAFRGGAEGGPQIAVDSDATLGPSPMDLLLLSLAGCMGVDVVMILEKSRVPLDSMEVEVEGVRAESPPRRFTSVRLVYRISGPGEEDEAKVQRAIDLSRDTYCSVLHTLDPELELDFRVERA